MTRNSQRNALRGVALLGFLGFAAANLAAQKLTPWASRDINGNPVYVPLSFVEAATYAACVMVMSAVLQLRRVEGSPSQRRMVRLLEAFGGLIIGVLIFLAAFAIFKYQLVGRYIVGISVLLSSAVIGIEDWIQARMIDDGWRRVLFVVRDGSLHVAREAVEKNAREFPGDYNLEEESSFRLRPPTMTVASLKERKITDVVFDCEDELRKCCAEYVLPIINSGIRALGFETLVELYSQKLDLRTVDDAWFLTFENDLNGRSTLRIKRLLDIAASTTILGLCSPLLPVIALCIKLQDGGPVLYKQTRKGLNGHTFQILKFRTMRVDSEIGGAVWASRRDIRVTGVGRVLRKTRLDEIPQLLNILRGEMSFVGPRPERPELVREIVKFVPQFELRELVKPGLTGWAQVKYPYGASVDDAREKLAYDLYYIKHTSVTLDLYIIAKTLFVITRGSR